MAGRPIITLSLAMAAAVSISAVAQSTVSRDFDTTKALTLSGIIAMITLPVDGADVYLGLDVLDPNGRDVRWAVQVDSPASSERTKWFGKQGTLRPGTKVTVIAYPLKAGSNAADTVARDAPWVLELAKAGRFVHGTGFTLPDGTRPVLGAGGVVPGKQ
jgi:hypothetical protein